MKKSILCLIVSLVLNLIAQAQQFRHIGPCNGSQHGAGICYGYAMGRAAGRDTNDAYCNPLTFHPPDEVINTVYFDDSHSSDASLTGLQKYDIVKFSAHVAYVRDNPGNPIGNTLVDSYSPMTGQQRGVTLNSLTGTFGDWQGYYQRKNISVNIENSFGGGNIKIDGGDPVSAGTKSVEWWGSARVFEAINYQESGNATQIFQYWSTPREGSVTTLKDTTYPKSGNTYTAHFSRRYNVTFSNYLPGGTGGTIKVAGVDRTSPYTTTVMQDSSISGQAINQTVSLITYTFSQWNDGITTNPRTFTPDGHTTYTANFTSKPLPPDNVSAGGTVGDYPHITWSEHPNVNVTQYQIWRRVKENGEPIHDALISAPSGCSR